MITSAAVPQCFVEIYPHEGGAYAIESGQVLLCNTTKSIREGEGAFEIHLAPGGPSGPNVGPTWVDVVTPMSFVLIGMARGAHRQITMVGVVTRISHSTAYVPGPQVTRTIKVVGADFGYFFMHFAWYALSFLNGPAAAVGVQLFGNANAGVAGLVSGLTSGTPDQIGKDFFTKVMDGDNGILSKSWVQYRDQQVPFSKAVSVLFEKYLEAAAVIFSLSYVVEEANWYQKFLKIFPFPWYEFFIMTAPAGFYDTALSTSWNRVSTGTKYTMLQMGEAVAAEVCVIARVNPLPMFTASVSGDKVTFGDMDTKAWSALPTSPDEIAFWTSYEEFSDDEVHNFYMLNPIFGMSQFGQSNDAVTPPMYQFAVAVDPASVHRYGFRPVYATTEWLADPTGQIAETKQTDLAKVVATMTARLASQYEPVSLMLRAERVGALRPDIVPGNRYKYQSTKDRSRVPWLFYIETVTHQYVFGGNSRTTLTLTRGLPEDVYADSGLLKSLHVGNAQRIDGKYETGLPSGPGGTETGLEPVSLLNNDIQKVLSDIAPIYSTAQKK